MSSLWWGLHGGSQRRRLLSSSQQGLLPFLEREFHSQAAPGWGATPHSLQRCGTMSRVRRAVLQPQAPRMVAQS